MWRYKLLLFILFIPLALYTLWQSARTLEFRYFLQRLAILFNTKSVPGGIWIHAASVGEVNAVIPLILKIHAEHPDTPITLTSNTTTSAAVALKQLPEAVQHLYFPLDYLWAMKRIVRKIKPKAIFIVETEFWPNFYHCANKKNIPLTIINGRISEKTLHAKDWLKRIYAITLPLVTKVYARSEIDKDRFIQLGANTADIEVLGNIKFSALTSDNIEPINLSRPYILAASTRNDEEQLIVDAWLKAKHSNHLLVIVPRHPNRLTEILSQLKKFNIEIAIRSKNEPVTPTTDIYIADTIGELKQFIAGSDFVLMGGSFVEKGGHNILEVAQLGKAVIFGPDMRSFEDEAKVFIKYNAGVQCESHELPDMFNTILQNVDYKKHLEKNARKLIDTYKNIINKYYDKLNSNI
ncbi:MAG: 3-deoxy-D-manno-octulosonic acid transferase [Gammaproteobacteria bacterium]|nr:3-deoxy-D-manno-octulosonic acid transferase [Gammaproteobacteria bacterium]